jgi:hypothetical protein
MGNKVDVNSAFNRADKLVFTLVFRLINEELALDELCADKLTDVVVKCRLNNVLS